MNNVKYRECITGLEDTLRGVMFCRELEFSAVRLIFIKYVVDNCIGASTREEMLLCNRAQMAFSRRDVNNGIDSIISVLNYIDNAYHLEGVLSGQDTINKYSAELFGKDTSTYKRSSTARNYEAVMEFLSKLDLVEDDVLQTKGMMWVNALVDEILDNSTKYGFLSECTTRQELSKLASGILNVSADDRYCDFVSGAGLSTLEIVKDKNTTINIADKDQSSVAIAAMLLIMSGYKDINVRCEDTLLKTCEKLNGNKIFVDAPFGRPFIKGTNNTNRNIEYKYNDYSLDVMDKIINDYLDDSDDAIAVMTIHPGFLFRSNRQTAEFKAKLIKQGVIKAVIALPPLKNKTAVNVNLIVLTRKYNDKIIFVDATECQEKSNNRIEVLPDSSIKKIISVIEESVEEEGFSKVISLSEIANKEYSLIPTMYIEQRQIEDNTTLSEVNSQLSDLYKRLLNM